MSPGTGLLVLIVILGLGPFWRANAVAPGEPPQNVTAMAISSTSIRVMWRDVPVNAQNGPLTEYEVTYAQGTFSSVPASDSVRIQAALEDSASLTGLQEYVQYRISVTAYNADGAGPSSAEVIVTTYQDVPSAPPDNFTVTASVPSKLTLTWNHPPEIDINGELRGYSLRYIYQGIVMIENIPIPAGDMPTFVLDNLENFTLYELDISATTINGTGPTTNVTQMTTENVPEVPPQNVTATTNSFYSLLVRWDAPDQEHLNGILRGFQLQHATLDPSITPTPWNKIDILPENVTTYSYLLEGFDPSTIYCIRVAAVTVGPGIFSDPLYIETLGGSTSEGSSSGSGSLDDVSSSSGQNKTPSPTPTTSPSATPAGGSMKNSSGASGSSTVVVAVSVAISLTVVCVVVAAVFVVVSLCLQRHRARYKLRHSKSQPVKLQLHTTNMQSLYEDADPADTSTFFANPATVHTQTEFNHSYEQPQNSSPESNELSSVKIADNPQYGRFSPQQQLQLELGTKSGESDYDYPATFREYNVLEESGPYSVVSCTTKFTESGYATVS